MITHVQYAEITRLMAIKDSANSALWLNNQRPYEKIALGLQKKYEEAARNLELYLRALVQQ